MKSDFSPVSKNEAQFCNIILGMPPHENSLRDNDVTLVIRSPARSRDNYGVVLCLVVKDEAPIHVPVLQYKSGKVRSRLVC